MEKLKKSRYTIPADDKGVFIGPPLSLSKSLINANMQRIKQYDFTICGLDYNNLSDQIRFEVIEKAKKYTKDLLHCWHGSLKAHQFIDSHSFNLTYRNFHVNKTLKGKIQTCPRVNGEWS